MKSFAQLETKRKCYSRDTDKVNIVIDATDWGHSVGEIEIMVMDQDHITEATTKIETIGAELGKILITHSLNVLCINLICINIIRFFKFINILFFVPTVFYRTRKHVLISSSLQFFPNILAYVCHTFIQKKNKYFG